MSTLEISKRFTLDATPDQVWSYLIEPSLVVGCLPGATLEQSSDDGRHHTGLITVKLGAFSVSYRGSAEFVEIDASARRLRVEGKGREKTGAGAVSMSMSTDVVPTESGTEVRVDAVVELAGKIVSFGRGMVGPVADEVLSSFMDCLSSTLAASHATGTTGRDGPQPPPPVQPPPMGLALLLRAVRRWLSRLFGRA